MKGYDSAVKIDAVFDGYIGKKRWSVSHPDHKKGCCVSAPDEASALMTAAKYWDRDWTRIEFYAYAEATQI